MIVFGRGNKQVLLACANWAALESERARYASNSAADIHEIVYLKKRAQRLWDQSVALEMEADELGS